MTNRPQPVNLGVELDCALTYRDCTTRTAAKLKNSHNELTVKLTVSRDARLTKVIEEV